MASLGRELGPDTAPSNEPVVLERASDLPTLKSPTILRLGCRTRTPFADDPSLAKGVEYYDGDSTSWEWPDYSQSKAHRLHEIPVLCSICDSLDVDALFRTGSILRYSLSDIVSAVKHCRLCALIVQCIGLRVQTHVSESADDLAGRADVVHVSFVEGSLTLVDPRYVFVEGSLTLADPRDIFDIETQRALELGKFKVLSIGNAGDTQPADCVGMPEGPATHPTTAEEKTTSVSMYRLISELERVIVSTSRCQICAPSSLPFGEENGLPDRLGTFPSLPDRVVEILSPLGTPAGQMLLRLKQVDSGDAALYTTLSHRWGGDRTLKTTKTTLRKHLQGFTMEELPRTFQDAVLITQALGIKYVWIDSLCIIQDNVDDWLCQAAKMGSIYSHSTFTIAAHSASQCNEGFLWRCQLPSTVGIAPLTGGPAFRLEIPEISEKNLNCARLQRSEIADRAWVLQELTLSPRILHFYENHLFWECEHGHGFPEQVVDKFKSSSAVSGNTSAALFRNARNSHGVHDAWLQLVHRYSACNLTNKSDRLVAIAGIANALQQGYSGDGNRVNCDYHCGIFDADVHRLLLWCMRSKDIRQGAGRHSQRAPSWSWANVDQEVDFTTLTNTHKRPPTKHLRLEGRQHQNPAMTNPICRLLIEAPVIRVLVQLKVPSLFLDPLTLPEPPAFEYPYNPVTMMDILAASQLVGWCWPDVGRLWPEAEEGRIVEHLTFLVVQSHDCEGSYKVPGAWCLIITPVQGGVGVYERIGIAFVSDEYVKPALERPETLSLV